MSAPASVSRKRILAETGALLSLALAPALFTAAEERIWPPMEEAYYISVGIPLLLGLCLFSLCVLRRTGRPWKDFGFVRPDVWRDLSLTALLVVAALGIRPIVRTLFLRIGKGGEAEIVPVSHLSPGMWVFLIGWLLVAALSEELFCRSYLVARLEQWFEGKLMPVLTSAGIFAAIHMNRTGEIIAGAFLFGLVYGAVFQRTRTIWPCVVGHAAANLAVITLKF